MLCGICWFVCQSPSQVVIDFYVPGPMAFRVQR